MINWLHPMIHIYKNSSGRIVRQVLCYRRSANKVGKADHRFDPVLCGWQDRDLGFLYIGPVLCCIRCHRHIWGRESYDKCPNCYKPLRAQATGSHSPVSYSGVPTGGTEVTHGNGQSAANPA